MKTICWLTVTRGAGLGILLAGLALVTGCSSTPRGGPANAAQPYVSNLLLEGDILRVSFPGVANSTQELPIPPSGKINLAFAGEYQAAGRTIAELESDILETYGPQLKVREVTVSLVASSASVYVSGAVLRPGRIPLTRPLTLVQAIMESGGPLPERSRLTDVRLVREEDGTQKVYRINVKRSIDADTDPVYLRPGDVINVPVKVFNL